MAVNTTKAPVDTTNAYFEAIETENYTEAFDLLCEEQKSGQTVEAWQGTINGNFTAHDFTAVTITNNEAIVIGDVTVDKVKQPTKVDLVKDGSKWKVCGASKFTSSNLQEEE